MKRVKANRISKSSSDRSLISFFKKVPVQIIKPLLKSQKSMQKQPASISLFFVQLEINKNIKLKLTFFESEQFMNLVQLMTQIDRKNHQELIQE